MGSIAHSEPATAGGVPEMAQRTRIVVRVVLSIVTIAAMAAAAQAGVRWH
jgi:hypothetical protein